jgi:hypothetical protein
VSLSKGECQGTVDLSSPPAQVPSGCTHPQKQCRLCSCITQLEDTSKLHKRHSGVLRSGGTIIVCSRYIETQAFCTISILSLFRDESGLSAETGGNGNHHKSWAKSSSRKTYRCSLWASVPGMVRVEATTSQHPSIPVEHRE